jgi:hypothetical protein
MALGFFVVQAINTYSLEQELKLHTDWLIPASDPQPKTACPDPTELPPGSLTLVMGSSAAYASTFPAAVVVIDQQIRFSLDRDPQGRIAVTTDVFDAADNVVVEIDHNRFTVASDVFKMERPDLSTLAVSIKSHKEEVLWVRFLNPSTIRVRGVFRWRDAPPVVVTDDRRQFLTWIRARDHVSISFRHQGHVGVIFSSPQTVLPSCVRVRIEVASTRL